LSIVGGAARKTRAPQEHLDAPITTRMTKVDSRLLAIARGDLEPDDPFGGLIPIYEDSRDDLEELEPDWLVLTPEPKAETSLFSSFVPRVRMRPDELLSLPLDERCSLFVSQIDGRRTLEEVIDACGIDEVSGLEAIDDLLRFDAIVLG
jgi:hypothetical protein